MHNSHQERDLQAIKRFWREGELISTSPALSVFQERGISGALPACFRYMSTDWTHTPGEMTFCSSIATAISSPSGETPIAVHRQFLSNDPVKPSTAGNWTGGAVRLAAATDTLILGVDIFSTMLAMQTYQHPGWACLTLPGLKAVRLPSPPLANQILILAKNNRSISYAHKDLAKRLEAEGRSVNFVLENGSVVYQTANGPLLVGEEK